MGIRELPGAGSPNAPTSSSEGQDQPEPRRVVVVDDHELLRAGTRRILDEASGFSVVGEAGDSITALRVIEQQDPDVVLIDIRLPTVNGIDLARQVISDHPHMTVLILSAYDDDNYVRAALAAGVSGYLLKTMPSEDLIRSITAACEGSGFTAEIPSGLGESNTDAESGTNDIHLTSREEEIVRLVTRGLTNKAIAYRLGISPRTVEGHLNHVFDKLGTSSRTELVHYALATNLFVRTLAPADTVP